MRTLQDQSTTGASSLQLSSRELKQSHKHGATPLNNTNRACTDSPCVLVLLAALGGFGMLYAAGASAGKLKPFGGLKNYEGETCGQDGRGQFIYFCTTQSQLILDISHQVCVDRCPSDSDDNVGAICSQNPAFGAASHTYGTTPLFNILCLPNGSPYVDQVLAAFGNNVLTEEALKLIAAFSHREIMALAAVASALASFAFLIALRFFTQLLVWICLFLMLVVPASLGIAVLVSARLASGEAVEARRFLSSGDPQVDLVIGIVLQVMSLAMLCIICCLRRQVELAVNSVKEACSCILEMPGLLLEPWFSLIGKVVVFIPGVLGFVGLLISGAGEHTLDFTKPSSFFSLDTTHVLMLVLYTILFIWVMELMHSISQFVVIYVAEAWYFNGSKHSIFSCFVGSEMLRGYYDAITCHLGSLIYGSIVLTCCRLVRYVVEAGTRAAKSSRNTVMYLLCCICRCCASCLEGVARYISRFAYMDVAMNASNYCEAAVHASQLILSSGVGLAVLESTLWLFTFCGIGGSAIASGAAVWLLVTSLPKYSDPTSSTYVEDEQSVILAAAIIGCLVAFPILHVLDTVADTMFYCNAAGTKRDELAAASEKDTLLLQEQQPREESIFTKCIECRTPALCCGPKTAAPY